MSAVTMGEKITALRKKECWSQEDLADRLDVSRQSVSKWEGDLAAPTVDKLLELSRLFGVSTDYLLKDELEVPDLPAEDAAAPLRQVSLEEARTFAEAKEASARPIALGVSLCILSPVTLIFLGGLAELGRMSDALATGLGLVVLFAFVVPAVAIFVRWGMRLDRYEYLEKEVFTPAPGVEALARSRKEALERLRARRITVGICLCVAAAVPLFAAMAVQQLATIMFAVGGVGLLLVMVAVGVYCILSVSIPWGAYQMLLQEGDYAPEEKVPWRRVVAGVYWCVVTAGYLTWSFASQDWGRTWVVWPVAGVLFGALATVMELAGRKKR